MKHLFLIISLTILGAAEEPVKGTITIFHAGSLAVPIKEMTTEFKKLYPSVDFLCESAGSRECARKITDLMKPCDVLVSADYLVIDQLLIPAHATWNIKFATNEIVIAYRPESRRATEITAENWTTILLDPKVVFGRSDPNADPAGYRSVMTMKLTEKHLQKPGLADKLLAKDQQFIRSKSVDLLAQLEVGALDYVFFYRSVAHQHGLKYVILPDEVNLKSPAQEKLYASVSVTLSGKTPGSTIEQKGEPTVYGVTIPSKSPNPVAARAFVRFLLNDQQGLAILKKQGQPSAVPSPTSTFDAIPEELKPFAKPLEKAK